LQNWNVQAATKSGRAAPSAESAGGAAGGASQAGSGTAAGASTSSPGRTTARTIDERTGIWKEAHA